MAGLQTEFPFTLPKGYVDADGTLHRHGTMRLATARDEIEPLRDQRIAGPTTRTSPILVAGPGASPSSARCARSTPHEVEGLFAADWRSCRTSTGSSTSAIRPTSRRCSGGRARADGTPPRRPVADAAADGDVGRRPRRRADDSRRPPCAARGRIEEVTPRRLSREAVPGARAVGRDRLPRLPPALGPRLAARPRARRPGPADRSVADLNDRAWEAIRVPNDSFDSERVTAATFLFEVDGVEIGRFMEVAGSRSSVASRRSRRVARTASCTSCPAG